MAAKSDLKKRIVDTALAMAEQGGWESVRLHAVAGELDIPLTQIHRFFREKEELIDAWFDRADEAMLSLGAEQGFQDQAAPEKIHQLLMRWLGILASHRRVTRQMVLGKLEPGHLHYQVSGLLRVSRTVQWLRESAGRQAQLPWRALEETALTSLYLMTFLYWMFDRSDASASTSRFLKRRLKTLWCCSGHSGASSSVSPTTS